jgi:hypothetical protein
VVTGDGGDGSPAIGPVFAWDDDPNSITYAGPDPIGDPGAPQRLGLTGVRLRVLGVQSSLSLATVCNPALEPGDVVAVEVDPAVWERHIIDSLSYTLGSASMSCKTRTTSRRL